MMTTRQRLGLLLVACLVGLPGLLPVRADEIILDNGRAWKGTIVREDRLEVVIATAGGDVTVPRRRIKQINRGNEALEAYKRFKDKLDMTDAEAQYELGLWAREHGLGQQAEFQFQLVLALDAEHAGAHEALGHVKHQGKWLTRKQYLAAKGYVRYRGRWVTPEQRDEIIERKRKQAEDRKWRSTIGRLAADLAGRSSRRRAEAEQRLLTIDDEAAFEHIVRLLNYRDDDVQVAACRAVAKNNITIGIRRMAELTWRDGDSEVRTAAAVGLRDLRTEDGMWMIVKALEQGDKRERQRAARALGVMKPRAAIPALIEALFWKNPDAGEIIGDPPEQRVFVPRVQYFGPDGKPLDQEEPEREPEYLINEDAWRALVTITGQDFDYAKPKWRQWYEVNRETLPEWPPRPGEEKPEADRPRK